MAEPENEDVASISEEEEPTPRPKRTAPKTKVGDDGISELASTDDPDWEMSLGDNDEGDVDTTDLVTMEEDDSDLEESPGQQKNKANLSKTNQKKNADKGKGKGTDKGKLRAAILRGHSKKEPVSDG